MLAKGHFVWSIISAALIVAVTILVPTTSYQISSITNNSPHPNEVTDWLKSHPNSFTCAYANIKAGISPEVSCMHPEAQVNGDPPVPNSVPSSTAPILENAIHKVTDQMKGHAGWIGIEKWVGDKVAILYVGDPAKSPYYNPHMRGVSQPTHNPLRINNSDD